MKPESGNSSPEAPIHETLAERIQHFVKDRLYIKDNAKPEQTIEGIKKDIEFRGFNLWILIPAIFIASIGLNTNSTAVIIGAMLISPLMGPIMGIGLSIGINDSETLRKSLRNLGIMITVSLITSTFFFAIIPFSEASSELLARTRPDLRDVFIGFFGGFAGILAGSRNDKNNVIPGVAIATALMPPLCTAGYGLASLQLEYFLGAAYLFLINAFFIALATVLVVKYLRFPVKSFLDKAKERRAKNILAATIVVMIVPATIIFYNVVNEALLKRSIDMFIKNKVNFDQTEIVKKEIIETDSALYINLVTFGETIPDEQIQLWQQELSNISKDAYLRIFQGNEGTKMSGMNKFMDLYTKTHEDLMSKEKTIVELERQIRTYESEIIPMSLISEIKVIFPDITFLKMGRFISTEMAAGTSTSQVLFSVEFAAYVAQETRNRKAAQLEDWLKQRLGNEHIEVELR